MDNGLQALLQRLIQSFLGGGAGFNSGRPADTPPTDPRAFYGMHQGAQGVAQGPAGAAVAHALGPMYGMQRAQLGGMLNNGPGQNPYRQVNNPLASTGSVPGGTQPDLAALLTSLTQRPMK